MNELTNYLPMLLALVLALTLVTNIIVQVLKSLLYDMLPTNLLAFLVAAVVTVGAGFGLWSYYRFAITGWMIVALIALIFLVAFSAMFGYDKLVQLMEQAGWDQGTEVRRRTMATAEKILEIARSQIGARESPANSDNVKYNTAYYGREVSGKYPWCAVFVWWVFREAGAPELYYGGGETAYCPTLMSFHKKQAVTDYRPGDIVFFNFSGKSSAGHVGICESWDGTYITTIDGNTGGASEDNGGAVMRRRRHKKYIVGAYRPDYEEEESVTYEQWLEYLERYRREAAAKKASMPELLAEAVELGLTDGSRPRDLMTREEGAIMARAAAKAR